jgi:Trypsin-like peptidase domain
MGVPRLRYQLLIILVATSTLTAMAGVLRATAVEGGLTDGDHAGNSRGAGSLSLPIATDILSDEKAKMLGAAVAVRRSLVLLISDDTRGTGFILSRQHRLVVTAGHVADRLLGPGSLFVVLEGSSEFRRIEKVWYHPRVKRVLDFGLHARSFDPRDGAISLYTPDLAVVQLSNDGGKLPEGREVRLDEGSRLKVGLAIGVLGYWGDEKVILPTETNPANASLARGTVCAAIERLGRIQSSYKEFFLRGVVDLHGGSGGPAFLCDGGVVGVVTGGVPDSGSSKRQGYACGVPIAELDELVAYHGLHDWVPIPAKAVVPRRDWGPDPRIPEFRQAVALVRQARELRKSARYRSAVETCNKILAAIPEYGGAQLERSKNYLYFLANHWAELSIEERRQYAQWALDDSLQCDTLDSSGNDVAIINIQNFVYRAAARFDRPSFQFVVEWTAHVLGPNWPGEPLTEHERSWLSNIKAQARHLLGEMDQARDDYDESVRTEPQDARWYLNRAQFRESCGHPELGQLDRAMAEIIARKRNAAETHRKD